MHPACRPDAELLAECEVTRVRRSGPGGQRRNKVETGVVLLFRPLGVRVEAAERRSQQDNLRVACRRLRERLAIEHREPLGSGVPSPLWQSRCRNGRIHVAVDHADFPALLAEAFDVLAAENDDLRAAASRLQVSPSQLLKLIARLPAAWQELCRRREARNLPPLKLPR